VHRKRQIFAMSVALEAQRIVPTAATKRRPPFRLPPP
jgi:hypothetical protein